MTSAVRKLIHVYENRSEAAKVWKEKGGKVVGYFDDAVPLELIYAAGLMPFRYYGDPKEAQDTMPKYVWALARKASLTDRQVTLGYINGMLQKIFTGEFDFVDFAVVPYSRKQILQIWQQLVEAKDEYPELVIPELHVLDRAITPTYDSSRFNKDRVKEFKSKLENWSGSEITEEKMREAIALTNEQRELIGQLNALRAERKVSGAEAVAITAAGKYIMPFEHIALLREAIAELTKAKPRSGPSVYLSGSPHDNLQFYKLIEGDGGATVVGENHFWGSRNSEFPVSTIYPPLLAIGDQYHQKPPAVIFPIKEAVRQIVEKAQEGKADKAIFVHYDGDNHELWEVPDARDALLEAGIPSLYLHTQPYDLGDGEPQRAEIKTFITEKTGALT